MTEPGKLGRLVDHSPANRLYPFKAARTVTYRTVRHDTHIGVLNQGDVGACTGFATVAAVASDPLWLPVADRVLDTELALAVYSDATRLDPFPGWYDLTKRAEDTGSSGLAAAKAAKARGLVSGYLWAFTFEDAMAALMDTPVITGIPWLSSFDHPDPDGHVKITADAVNRGGHEVCAVGYDTTTGRVRFRNSWGPGWGDGGEFTMIGDDWRTLLAQQGDVTRFVPADKPAPAPGAASFRLTPATAARVASVARKRGLTGDGWLDGHLRAYFGIR